MKSVQEVRSKPRVRLKPVQRVDDPSRNPIHRRPPRRSLRRRFPIGLEGEQGPARKPDPVGRLVIKGRTSVREICQQKRRLKLEWNSSGGDIFGRTEVWPGFPTAETVMPHWLREERGEGLRHTRPVGGGTNASFLKDSRLSGVIFKGKESQRG